MGELMVRQGSPQVTGSGKKVLLVTALAVTFIGAALIAQDASNVKGNKKADVQDVLLNDFETSEDWRAFSTTPLGITKVRKTIQLGPIEDVFNPKELSEEEKTRFKDGLKDPKTANNVLGVKTFFKEKGFDRVEIKPPHEYLIKGLGRQFSVWVLGRNYRHTLFIKLRDYKGNLHKLKLGKLDYFGWRKHTATVPGWLPQSTRHALLDKNLHFVSLYVECDPHETWGDFYFYVDDLRVKTDLSDSEYPGSKIKDNW